MSKWFERLSNSKQVIQCMGGWIKRSAIHHFECIKIYWWITPLANPLYGAQRWVPKTKIDRWFCSNLFDLRT